MVQNKVLYNLILTFVSLVGQTYKYFMLKTTWGFSYPSKSGSRGHLIWEKQLANIFKIGKLDWRNQTVHFIL